MSVDRRSEAVMGLAEVIEAQGYAIIPLLMQKLPDTDYAKNRWEAAGELPLKDKGYEHVHLGWMKPFLRDPFNPRHESRLGRFLIYDPKVMDVMWVGPLNGHDISDWPDRLREEGYAVVDTTGREEDPLVVGIRRKSAEPAVPVTTNIY